MGTISTSSPGVQGNRLYEIPIRSRLTWKVELIAINSMQERTRRQKTTWKEGLSNFLYFMLFNGVDIFHQSMHKSIASSFANTWQGAYLMLLTGLSLPSWIFRDAS